MRAADKALVASIPRFLCRRRSPNLRSGQSCVRRGRDHRGHIGFYQIRKWADCPSREAIFSVSGRRRDVDFTTGRAHPPGLLRGPSAPAA